MSKKKNALLWEINGEDLSTSYLFGTMHVRDQRAFRYEDLVKSKIKDCEVYAGEMNLDEINHVAMANSMDLDQDVYLHDLLKPKIYKRLSKLLKKQTGLSLIHFDNSQPILVTNLLTESLLSRDAKLSLDASLWEYAKSEEKITIGIESFEEQMHILSNLSLDYQIKGLSDLVRNFKKFSKQLQKLTALYEKADIHRLYKKSKSQAGKMRKLMIYDRNKIMADRIELLINEQAVFISVGAGHLSGGKGIIRLLKKAGFKLRPVPL